MLQAQKAHKAGSLPLAMLWTAQSIKFVPRLRLAERYVYVTKIFEKLRTTIQAIESTAVKVCGGMFA